MSLVQFLGIYFVHRAGIDVMLANRIVNGLGLTAPRFRWVAFDDALMLPLDTRDEASRTPDTRSLYPKEAALLRRYMRELMKDYLRKREEEKRVEAEDTPQERPEMLDDEKECLSHDCRASLPGTPLAA